jgi:hypothetical protein
VPQLWHALLVEAQQLRLLLVLPPLLLVLPLLLLVVRLLRRSR